MKRGVLPALAFAVLGLPGMPAALGANSGLPGGGFSGDRYAALWKKSPFAIATPEQSAASDDYRLVGLAQFDGVSYASLVVTQTQEHFVLTSEKPFKNLKLVSVQRDSAGISAVIDREGERLVLHEDNPPAPAAGAVAPVALPMTGNPSVGGVSPSGPARPHVRFHRPLIVVPPRPSN